MMDLIKSIIKWVIIVVLFVLLIVLISRIATKKEQKNKIPNNGVQEVESIPNDSDFEPIVDDNGTESDLIVDAPDTGASAGLSSVIGIIILCGTTYFIYKKQEA